MRKYLLPLASSFLLAGPAFADFGSADTKKGAIDVSTFNAWCGEERTNCKIDFTKKKIIINDTSSVDKSQIKEVRYSIRERKCAITLLTGNNCAMPVITQRFTNDILYKKNDGTDGNAKVMFRDLNAGRRFFDTMTVFLGAKSSDVSKDGLTGYVINAKKKNVSAKSIPLGGLGIGIGAGLAIGIGTVLILKQKKA